MSQQNDMRFQFVQQVAAMLEETEPKVKGQINAVVKKAGVDGTMSLLKEVLTIEQGDGMLTLDGSRRRTPGGVFLLLAKQKGYLPRLSPEQSKARWKQKRAKARAKKKAAREQQVTPSLPEQKTA